MKTEIKKQYDKDAELAIATTIDGIPVYDRNTISDNLKDSNNKLSDILEEKGVVIFIDDTSETISHIWETDQGDDNIRGEDDFNYMINIYEYNCSFEEIKEKLKSIDLDDLEENEYVSETDGGLCTGYPLDAITFFDGTEEEKYSDYDDSEHNPKIENDIYEYFNKNLNTNGEIHDAIIDVQRDHYGDGKHKIILNFSIQNFDFILKANDTKSYLYSILDDITKQLNTTSNSMTEINNEEILQNLYEIQSYLLNEINGNEQNFTTDEECLAATDAMIDHFEKIRNEDNVNEYIGMLEDENKSMAEFLEKIGYSDEDISNIANKSFDAVDTQAKVKKQRSR